MQSQPPKSSITPLPSQYSHTRWHAITHRTLSSHSSFLYGVISTKIYCRPTCSARLARRANIVYYDTKAQALHDGFRPCKRCKPDDPTFVGEGEEIVSRAIALLRPKTDCLKVDRGLKELAKEVGVTPSYLCRVFKKRMGITIGTYMKEFEKVPSECETDGSGKSPSEAESSVVHEEIRLQTPATTAKSLSAAPVEGETDNSDQSPPSAGSSVVHEEIGPQTPPATTEKSLAAFIEYLKERPGSWVDEDMGNLQEPFHFDFPEPDIDFNDWTIFD